MVSRKNSTTKEEDILLEDFSRKVSFKSSVLFYGNALIVSVIPIWIYWRILHMDIKNSLILFFFTTLVSTYLISFSYKNLKYFLKHQIAQLREEAIRKEINYALVNDKKMSRKEKDDRILWRKNEVSDYEATAYSIFFNNLLFLFFIILTSVLIFKKISLPLNYLCSILISSGIIAVRSTTHKIVR